jgi:sulfite oxidase
MVSIMMDGTDLASRRDFLGRTIALGAAGVVAPAVATAEEPRLIVRSRRPLDAETPVEAFEAWRTPNRLFFVRSHFGAPAIGLEERWTIAIEGGVKSPRRFAVDELEGLEHVTIPAVLQCSGNGRALYAPTIPGVGWAKGAVGNAEWTGVRLADLLDRAGIEPGSAHVHLHGADAPPMPKTPAYLRSIPLDRALAASTLIATRMNGEPLPALHGGPARLVVPGWSGNHWIKWLRRIVVSRDEAPGFYMQTAYKMPIRPLPPGVDPKPNEVTPVTVMNVKSLIARPTDGSVLKAGRVAIVGVAWTGGEATISRVEVAASHESGRPEWREVTLEGPARPFTWRVWRHAFEATPGPLVIRTRATDSTGATQPETSPWNKSGYLWNGYDRVACEVR